MSDRIATMTRPATTILAMDLGKFRSVACVFEPATGAHRFQTIATTPQAVHELLVELTPATLVLDACSVCGWICDLADTLGIAVRVANTNGEAWKWRRVKRKTDRDDALKLATLAASDQLPIVHVPKLDVRQHRALIKYRHALIDRRTGVKNTIRGLLDAQGLSLPARSRGWTKEAIAELTKLARPLEACELHELWRGQLAMELAMLEQLQRLIKEADAKLDALQSDDDRMRRLKTIPQVGNRLAELVVTSLDEAGRFESAAQVSAYAGLVPKQYQSGQMNRVGRITGQGPGLLRRVLVQVAWGMARREGTRGKAVFDRLCHGQRTRRKQAAVALARKILVWCWAICVTAASGMRAGSRSEPNTAA